MQKIDDSIVLKILLLVSGVLSISPLAAAEPGSTLPLSTALPVRFVNSVDATKVHRGDVVTAETLQVVMLPSGQRLPKGTLVQGHVVDARPFRFDQAPYAAQKASQLSIHFDQIRTGNLTLPVNLSVRALASSVESRAASTPHFRDETDSSGTMTLIGGTEFSPFDKAIRGKNGEVVGYNRKQGVFARLTESYDAKSETRGKCAPTDTEQSVAIFSPEACGLYGFANESMPHAGRSGSGTFTLESRDHSVRLDSGSTALLQETEEPGSQQ